MTAGAPRVSVIVPAFNAAGHIGEALESVHAQTVGGWEVVVCDDGSSDDTAAVASSFGDRVRLVRHERNQGLAAARNSAIEHSQGSVLALLDADDVWLPRYLERQLQLLDQAARPEAVGIVGCNAYLRDPHGRLPGAYADRFGYAEDVTVERLLDISPIFISALIPRAALERVGVFATDLRSCEDLDLWIRLVEAGYQVVSTREPLAVYRLSAGQLSAQPVEMARARQAVYRRAIERGQLTATQRRAAQRAIRREQAIETVASLTASVRDRRLPDARPSELARLVRAMAENPARWRRWAGLNTASRRRRPPPAADAACRGPRDRNEDR